MSNPESKVDRHAIQKKYAEERVKRLRDDANDQYVDPSSLDDRYLADPHTPPFEREARSEEVDAVIVGAGFGGLLLARELREAGVKQVRLVEKAGGVGGTWYWNRYPGAQCDIESYMYMPLLEETGAMPTERYAMGPEIREHAERIAEHYNLMPDILFQTQLTEARWSPELARWIIKTDRGDELAARFICSSSGPLNRPKFPAIRNLHKFQGHSFHTSRWDYGYTGGSETSPLDWLHDKRVGVIGTGATALQAVPVLARDAKELYVFQRTPSTVGVRGNRPTDPDWFKSLEPGWQRKRINSFAGVLGLDFSEEDLVRDGWTEFTRLFREELKRTGKADALTPELFRETLETAAHIRMKEFRVRIDEVVKDPATAEALKPWYDLGCKRWGFHDEYLDAFNQPNVTLVDTLGKGVDELTPTGAVVAGKTIELDCIIYATGFETGPRYTHKSDFEFIGRDGRTLTEHWGEGIRTFQGWITDGFPNLFFMMNAQGAQPANYVHMLSELSHHIGYVISELMRRDAPAIEPEAGAVDAWVREIITKGQSKVAELEACTPGYYNGEGLIDDRTTSSLPYAEGGRAMFAVLEKWRNEGDFANMKVNLKG